MNMKRCLSVVVLALTVTPFAFAVNASASTARTTSGVVHVYESGSGISGVDSDVFTGAIVDHGNDHLAAADNGSANKMVLSKGTFEVNVASLDKKVAPTTYDPTTCAIVLSGTAPTQLSDGTGAYQGIRGTVTVTITEANILPKLKDGKCNQSQNAPPVASVIWITGSGTVSFT